MLFVCIVVVSIFSSCLYSGELPPYILVQNVLEESEMRDLNKLTESKAELLWYGRYNFWKENFEATLNDAGPNFVSRQVSKHTSDDTIADELSKLRITQNAEQDIIIKHDAKHAIDAVSDKLSKLFLMKVQELGADIARKRIFLLSYFDRNIVNPKNAESSGLFWHRDSITVDEKQEIADYTFLLLTNGKIQNWKGAKVVLQQGGNYRQGADYQWINSDNPEVEITPRYNQAIIFKNSDTGHMVTPLILLSDETVQRDVFILNCFLQ